jgi:hypothetical protein
MHHIRRPNDAAVGAIRCGIRGSNAARILRRAARIDIGTILGSAAGRHQGLGNHRDDEILG